MKVKGISFEELKAEAFKNEKVYEAYMEERRAEELRDLLKNMRMESGMNISQLAEKMGVSQPAISRLERNANRASIATLTKYANACGKELKIKIV